MESSFVPPDVIAERFERLKTVVDRSALARHQARVGRSEEALVEGVSRRDESMLTGRTRQGKLIHFPGGTTAGTPAPGCVGPGDGDRRPPPSPLRPPGGGDGAAPASRAHPGGERLTAVALVGVTASGKSETALELALRRGDCEIVSVDSMCVYRGMDIGTSKPGPEARAAVPHHLLDLVDPDEDFTVTQFQQAAREALAGIAAARASRAAGRRHRALPAGRRRRPRHPGPLSPTWPPRSRRSWTRAGPGRPTCTPASPRSIRWVRRGWSPPTAGGSSAPWRSPSGRAGPSRRSGPGSRPIRPAARPRSACPGRPTRSTAAIAARFGRMVRGRPGGRGAGPGRPSRRHVADGAPGARATARSWPTWRAAHPWPTCLEEAVRRTRQFARRQASWFRRDPRVSWAGSSAEAQALLEEALAVHG